MTSAPAAPAAKGSDHPFSKPLLLALAICGGFAPFAIDAYLPGLPAIADEFGVEASTAQLSLTGFLVAMGLSQLIIGPVSDQYGRRRLLLLGLAGAALASLACALAPSMWVLIVARVAQGAFGAAGILLSRAIVADLGSGIGVARAFSLLMSIQSLAPVVAPMAGGLLVPTLGWRSVFVFLALLSGTALLLAWRLVPESLPVEDRHPAGIGAALRSMGHLLTSRHYVAAVGLFIMTFCVMFAYIAGSPFVLQRINGFTDVQYSIAFAINSGTLLVTNLLNARIVQRVDVHRWVSIMSGVLAVAVLWLTLSVLVLDTAAWAVLIGFFLIVVSNGFLFPNIAAITLEASGGRNGSGSALMGAGQFTLAAIVAPLTGLGDGTTALPMVVVMLVAVAAQLTFLTLLHRHRDRG